MKVALVHDWLIHMRGGERVLEALAELYPDATVYTLFFDRSKLSAPLQKMNIRASWLQKVPGIKIFYRWLLPVLPWIIRTLDASDAELVVSSSHCVAKGIGISPSATHICYCHTPMRYLWGQEDVYFGKMRFGLSFIIQKFILPKLRKWDLACNCQVHNFVANSENVKGRIKQYYDRDAEVIYPPLDTDCFYPAGEPRDYYLIVSAFVPYKRVDVVIKAFNQLERRLLVVGKGPLEEAYRDMRQSEKISFLGSVSDEQLRKLYSESKAVIFPTFEDFGIVPLEAQACGTPVIAFGQGGALESVKSGTFFKEQTPEAVAQAVLDFESQTYDRSKISGRVASFSKENFKKHFKQHVEKVINREGLYASA